MGIAWHLTLVAAPALAGGSQLFLDGFESGDACAWSHSVGNSGSSCTPLFFSEYGEGSGVDKALEVFNAGTGPFDLGLCEIDVYVNGAATASSSTALTGSLSGGSVYVVCNIGLDENVLSPSECDLSTSLSYNGDDAVALRCDGSTLDVIGQIGFDPGSEWEANGVGTRDEVLRRACSVTGGNGNGSDPFDPSLEFSSFQLDDFTGFGQRGCL